MPQRLIFLFKYTKIKTINMYQLNTNEEFEVENFTYNGFIVNAVKGVAKYKAKFNSWTADPGILSADCSDGKQRLIPSCCLIGERNLPIQNIEKDETGMAKNLFGTPSKS